MESKIPNTKEADSDVNSDGVDINSLFESLSNRRRRAIITMLAFTDENELEIGDIAERIAADENDKPAREVTAQERKRVYIGLHQVHGPSLDNSDIVTYDGGTFTLEQSHETEYALDILNNVYDAPVPTADDLWRDSPSVFERVKQALPWGSSDAT